MAACNMPEPSRNRGNDNSDPDHVPRADAAGLQAVGHSSPYGKSPDHVWLNLLIFKAETTGSGE